MSDLKSPLLSVVVPIYNTKQYLKGCLDSIVDQTYRNLEIILVDDGSTDGSSEIADEYAKNDSRIKVVHQINGGIVNARKTGMAIATGSYSTQVDSDDWIDLDYYERMMKIATNSEVDVVTGGEYREYDGYTYKEFDRVAPGYYGGEKLTNEILSCMMYKGYFFEPGLNIHIFTKIYKTSLIKHYQSLVDDRVRVGEDAAVVYPLASGCDSIYISNICGYHYRMRLGSCMDTKLETEENSINILEQYMNNQILNGKRVIPNADIQTKMLLMYIRLLQVPDRVFEKDGSSLFDVKGGESIIIYGKGRFGKTLYNYYSDCSEIYVTDWIDNTDLYAGDQLNESVRRDIVNSKNRVLIAVLKADIRRELELQLTKLGVDGNRIIKWTV